MLGRFMEVYCDDILFYSKTREEHLVHTRIVMETLQHHKLYAKPEASILAPIASSAAPRSGS
jgi:hypothetical protein